MNKVYTAVKYVNGTALVCGPLVTDYFRAHDYACAEATAEIKARDKYPHLQQEIWPQFGVAEFEVLSYNRYDKPAQVTLIGHEVTVEALLNK
jgi:hypothetical protein